MKACCSDCDNIQKLKVMIPHCDKNTTGLIKDAKSHGNEKNGITTCDDEYCHPDEFEYEDNASLDQFTDYYFRCSICDSLNVNIENVIT